MKADVDDNKGDINVWLCRGRWGLEEKNKCHDIDFDLLIMLYAMIIDKKFNELTRASPVPIGGDKIILPTSPLGV